MEGADKNLMVTLYILPVKYDTNCLKMTMERKPERIRMQMKIHK